MQNTKDFSNNQVPEGVPIKTGTAKGGTGMQYLWSGF
jgi:hypothetical protein